MNKKSSSARALRCVTLAAMWRRRTACILLVAVMALSVFAAVTLQDLAARQSAAMDETVKNTRIHCVVTDARGTGSDNLQMISAFVDMLMGMRHERGCYLDEYVRNVRAKSTLPLENLKDVFLCRILSFDSDRDLSETTGVRIELEDGWTEEVLLTRERVCLIPNGMPTHSGPGGLPFVTVTAIGVSVDLQVIGTVYGSVGNTIWAPFYMQRLEEGVTESFFVDSCTFDIRDNARLEECRAAIYETFVKPDLTNTFDGLAYGVLVQDEIYLATLSELRSNLSMLRILIPLLMVLCGGIGFLSAYLATRGRVREFAVMRCLGMRQRAIFAQVFGEQALLAVLGAAIGGLAGLLVDGAVSPAALGRAALLLAVFLTGAAAANWNVTRVNVMRLMKVEE